jgi:hypothetical protein
MLEDEHQASHGQALLRKQPSLDNAELRTNHADIYIPRVRAERVIVSTGRFGFRHFCAGLLQDVFERAFDVRVRPS